MKKITITLLSVLILALTACSGGTSNTQQFNQGQSTNTSPNEMPLASKLVVGSFKLDGTDNAITAGQATELIPLWQVYQQLSTSDTAAQEEITALTEQIQETMTTEQMNAIDFMNLTPQDISTTMQEQGVQFGGNNGNGQGTNGQNNGQFPNGGNFQPPEGGGGQFFGGLDDGGPGGGGSGRFNGGQNLSPEQIATLQARRAENGGGGNFRFNSTPTPLIEALVKLLQERATPSS